MVHPGGRPTKYEPWMCEKIVEIMSQGGAKVEAASAIGVSRDTFNQWEKDADKQEFSDAVKTGEQLSQTWWLSTGRKNLENQKFSAALWYMNMKNRFGWTDKTEVNQRITTFAPLEISRPALDVTEIAALDGEIST